MPAMKERLESALVLAAHGSSDDPRCAMPVRRQARIVAARGIFAEVACVFWMEPPFFRDVYETVRSAEIIVVPVMAAAGYYARTVLPREMRASHVPAGRNLTIAEPVGTLPAMADLIEAQARDAAAEHGWALGAIDLLVVGHGTRRDPARSGASTHRHVALLRRRGLFAGVHPAFLEQDPTIAAAVASIPGEGPIVVVPNLVADGGHALDDIPAALDLPPATRGASIGGRPIAFAPAAGERPECVELILASALAAAVQEARP
jgi:sirohydrochlorin ferrochelatase